MTNPNLPPPTAAASNIVLPDVKTALALLPLMRLDHQQREVLLGPRGVRGLIELYSGRLAASAAERQNLHSAKTYSIDCETRALARRELEGRYCASRYLRVRLSEDVVVVRRISRSVRHALD